MGQGQMRMQIGYCTQDMTTSDQFGQATGGDDDGLGTML